MPSPVGHALGGLVAGRLVERLVARPQRAAVRASRGPGATPTPLPGPGAAWHRPWWALAALAMSPDLDLLVGTHSTYSHSVGAVALVAVLSGRVERRRAAGRRPALAAALVAAATYGSHLLLDWLGTDTSPPVGIMLWWPFSGGFSKGPVSWFPSVSREVLSRAFWVDNTFAVMVELVTLGPLLWLLTRTRWHPQ